MKNNNDWNPELYMKFGVERTQPSIDLVNKIEIDFQPGNIADIGCGPGNSTGILRRRWPSTHIVGVDNSPQMIEKARKDFPAQEWILSDANSFEYPSKFDIIFSNATIQWIPNHQQLLERFYSLLAIHGILAIQMPLFWDMSLGKAIAKIADEGAWKVRLSDVKTLFTIHDNSFYYDVLSAMFGKIDLWETHYMHVMDSHLSILEMIRSTGLKPYLERLENDDDKRVFEELVLKSIAADYHVQQNKKVLFPFKRLFFIAYK